MKNILSVEHDIHTREKILENYAEKEAGGNTLTEYEKKIRKKCEKELPELREAARFLSEHIVFC